MHHNYITSAQGEGWVCQGIVEATTGVEVANGDMPLFLLGVRTSVVLGDALAECV